MFHITYSSFSVRRTVRSRRADPGVRSYAHWSPVAILRMRWITFQYRLDFGRDGENVGVGLAESGSAPTPQQAFYPSKLFCAAERAARHSLRNVLSSAEAHLHREETYGGIATSSLKIEMQCEPTENKAGALGKTPV